MRHAIDKGRVAYEPNSLAGGCPMHSPQNLRAFTSYAEKIDAHKVRERGAGFGDHFSQARLFWNSLALTEQRHLVEAAQFELGKVETQVIGERMIGLFNQVDPALAAAMFANRSHFAGGQWRSSSGETHRCKYSQSVMITTGRRPSRRLTLLPIPCARSK